MVRICGERHSVCEPSCVNGDCNQNAHPANQHDGSGHVETFAFFQGEQLDNEQDERHNGENDREDHKGLHGFEGSLIFIANWQLSAGPIAQQPESR